MRLLLFAKNVLSKQEIAQLESLGEDTSDGQTKIQEREQTIQALEQRYRDLLNGWGKWEPWKVYAYLHP